MDTAAPFAHRRDRRGLGQAGLGMLAATLATVLGAGVAGAGVLDAGAAEPRRANGGAPPEVTLLDRGASPRTELRYTLPVGTQQTITMRTYSNIGQRSGGSVRSGGTPNITFTISATVADVAPTGDVTIDYRYDDVEVSNDAPAGTDASAVAEAVRPIVGLTGSTTITDTGAPVANNIDVPDGLDPTATQLVEQLSGQASQLTSAFPTAAVGRGGRWRVNSTATLNGITFTNRTTFTLQRIKGTALSIGSTLEQRAPRQTYTAPGTDTPVTLLSSRGTGSGTITVDPATHPLPLAGTIDTTVRQKVRAAGQGLSQTVRVAVFFNEHR